MFWLAVVFVVAAFALFVVQGLWPEKPRKFSLVALGLACLSVAWAVQVIFTSTGGRLTVH